MSIQTTPIILTFGDGTLGVMHFVTRDSRAGWTRQASEVNIELEIARSAFPPEKGGVQSWRCPEPGEQFPTDRTFRNAWRDRGGKVEVDMPHARELHRDRLRELRAPRLAELDIEYQRADEAASGKPGWMERLRGLTAQDAKGQIIAAKQRLRDVTADPRIEAAQTPEELKSIGLPE